MITLELNHHVRPRTQPSFWKQCAKAINHKVSSPAQRVISVATVGPATMRKLNTAYRGKDYPTTVLSFSHQGATDFFDSDLLGEVILCPAVIQKRAQAQNESFERMLAWLFIHGVLHLLGYDHQRNHEAQAMEQLESQILSHARL